MSVERIRAPLGAVSPGETSSIDLALRFVLDL
jgi:hypothetical protein